MGDVLVKVSVQVTSSSVANPSVITTPVPHGFQTGDSVTISGHTGSTPAIDGTHTVTRLTSTSFSIPVNVTVGGSGGKAFGVRAYEPGSVSWTAVVNARDTAEATIYDQTGEFRPALDAEVIIEEDAVEQLRGFIDRVEEEGRVPQGSPIKTRIEVSDFNALPERVLVTATIPYGTLKSHLQALVPYLASAPYSITLHPSQADGPNINLQVHTLRKLAEVLNDLTTLSGGWLWEIDSSRQLRMTSPDIGVANAEFTISDGDERIEGDLRVTRSRDRYANRVWVKAGTGAEVNDRVENFVGPGTSWPGGFTYYPFTPTGVSFTETPGVVIDNGANKVIGAPGSWDNGTHWEWSWWWASATGSGSGLKPWLIHNDGVYGAVAPGRTITVWNKGYVYYNLATDLWPGNLYTGPSSGYRWYWGGLIKTRNRPILPHTVFVNGVPAPIGAFGTRNDLQNADWDWVWQDSDPPLLGHRQGATALGSGDTVTIYSPLPYELLVQAPTAASEPTSEQTTYGLWEELIEAPNVFTYDDVYALANQWLQRRLVRPVGLRYTTLHGRLTPGLVQSVVAASRNINGNFLIVESKAQTRERDRRVEREISLVDNITYINTWRDEFAQWINGGQISGGSSTSLTLSGSGGSGSTVAAKVYGLSMREDGAISSGTPDWVAASNLQARINTVERGSTAAVAYIRMRALSAGVSVQARIWNAGTAAVVGGPSAVVSSTSWTWVVIPVTLTAGEYYYELQLLPGAANAPVVGIGWIE